MRLQLHFAIFDLLEFFFALMVILVERKKILERLALLPTRLLRVESSIFIEELIFGYRVISIPPGLQGVQRPLRLLGTPPEILQEASAFVGGVPSCRDHILV